MSGDAVGVGEKGCGGAAEAAVRVEVEVDVWKPETRLDMEIEMTGVLANWMAEAVTIKLLLVSVLEYPGVVTAADETLEHTNPQDVMPNEVVDGLYAPYTGTPCDTIDGTGENGMPGAAVPETKFGAV